MTTERRRAAWTTTLATALTAMTAMAMLGATGCDRSAQPGSTTATPSEPPSVPRIDISTDPPGAPPATAPDREPPAVQPASPAEGPPENAIGFRFPDNLYYTRLPEGFRDMETKPVRKFSYSRWVGGTEQQIKELERLIGPDGRFNPCLNEKVVIVQYWTTAAKPGLRTIEKNNELLQRFADEDVVFVAIHPNVKEWGVDTAGAALESHGAEYPSAIDAEDRSTEMDWKFDVVPGYVLIDPRGIVRAAGLRSSVLPEAVDTLLEEWRRIKAASGGT